MKKREPISSQIDSVISAGVSIRGDLVTQGSIRIDGNLEGKLDVKGNLLLGEKGCIKGEVKAANFVVAGTMEGNVIVSEKFEITSTGCMNGELTSKVITIDEGGVLQGTSKMSSPKLEAKRSVPATS